jgi:hypothetical protein
MRRYRIPTHLTVEPSLIRTELGPFAIDLTFRQATTLAAAAGFGYWLWQASGLPPPAIVIAGLAALLLAVVAAFVTVGGRSADLWLRDALRYAVRPHILVWRPAATADPAAPPGAWAEHPLRLAWAPPGSPADPAPPAAAG